MTKQTNALLLVGILFISSMAGCLSEVSSQVESENTDLKIENAELNSTITNLNLENQNLTEMIRELGVLLEQKELQSIEHSASIEALNHEIMELDLLLAEANQIISESSNGEGGLMNDPTTPLLFETYNSSDKYMNHANWNGGLWERVTFDDDGIPKVQYSHGLEYVPTTAFHWGLVCISKWIVSGNQSNFDDAMEIAVWAVENQSANGGWGWYFNHSFHGGVLGDMYSGWYGAMTQGLGMSFMARMYAETGNESFKQSALDAMDLFDVHVDQGGVLRMYDGQPWYEEYPTPDAGSFVLNGYIYALIGLHDLHEAFNSTKALELYTNGTDSLYSMIGLFDLGCSSSYDLVHHSVPGTAPNIARDGYHSLHISLLSVMNVFENDGFQTNEDRWIGYANEQCFQSPNGANS